MWRRPGSEELLTRLVAFDSTSSNSNLPIADFICEQLDRPGYRIRRLPGPEDGKVNLLVRCGPEPEPQGPGLVLSGHMDVVPPGGGWESDPFVLTDGGDIWIGRGVCDMKGFLALALDAACGLAAARLQAPLVLLLTCDEELGGKGAEHLVAGWPPGEALPRAALIGEPTELRPVRMHKGHLKLRLVFRGKSAHSAYPGLGVNAIEPAARAVVALARLRRRLESERTAASRCFPNAPYPALNVGRLEGGTAINVVPDSCTVEAGIRTLPGTETDGLLARIRKAVAEAVPGSEHRLELLGHSPPMSTPADASLFRFLAALLGEPELPGVSFFTDAGWLQQLGLECVVCGPGSITSAHRPNEHLPKSELVRGSEMLDGLVRRFCYDASP